MPDEITYIRTEREVLEDILDLYKDLPCLWDVGHTHYKNKQARQNALEVLLEKWKIIDKNITFDIMKKKLENMKTTFFRERKKVEASKSTGAGAEDIYKPALWYFDHMMFLIENQKPKRSGVDSIECEDDESEKIRVNKKSKKPDLQNKQLKLLDTAERLLCSQEDPTENIARAMASQLKEMSKLQRCMAEKLISEIIFHGKLDQLTVNSFISSSSMSSQNIQTPRHTYGPIISPFSDHRSLYTPSPSLHSQPSPSPCLTSTPYSPPEPQTLGQIYTEPLISRDSCISVSIPEGISQTSTDQDYHMSDVPLQSSNLLSGGQILKDCLIFKKNYK